MKVNKLYNYRKLSKDLIDYSIIWRALYFTCGIGNASVTFQTCKTSRKVRNSCISNFIRHIQNNHPSLHAKMWLATLQNVTQSQLWLLNAKKSLNPFLRMHLAHAADFYTGDLFDRPPIPSRDLLYRCGSSTVSIPNHTGLRNNNFL